jgi:hypothetical protein
MRPLRDRPLVSYVDFARWLTSRTGGSSGVPLSTVAVAARRTLSDPAAVRVASRRRPVDTFTEAQKRFPGRDDVDSDRFRGSTVDGDLGTPAVPTVVR